MAEVDYNFDGKTEADILLSFKAAKGRRTRNFNKITDLLALQEAKYSRFTETTLLVAAKEMERQMDKLVLLTGYLQIHRLASASAHVTEANTLLTATEEQAPDSLPRTSRRPRRHLGPRPGRRRSTRHGKTSDGSKAG